MIERFNKHLNRVFSSYKKNDKIMEFKEELLGSLMDRFNELKAEGLSDEESYVKSLQILEGIKDTIKTLEDDYSIKTEPKIVNKYLLPALSYWLVVIIVYLGISFTQVMPWSRSWTIVVAGALLFAIILSAILFKITKEKGMKLASRFNILTGIMLLSTVIFLAWSFITKQWHLSWITYVAGIMVWYLIDIFMRMKGKKKMSITSFDAIIVTVLASLIVYIIISFTFGIWATSWLVFVVMALLIIVEIMLFEKLKK